MKWIKLKALLTLLSTRENLCAAPRKPNLSVNAGISNHDFQRIKGDRYVVARERYGAVPSTEPAELGRPGHFDFPNRTIDGEVRIIVDKSIGLRHFNTSNNTYRKIIYWTTGITVAGIISLNFFYHLHKQNNR